MDVSYTCTYEGSLEHTTALLLSKELADARAHALHLSNYACEVVDDGVTKTATLTVVISPEMLPEKVRGFLPKGASATITSTLTPSDTLETTTITHRVAAHGAPVKISGTVVLSTAAENATTTTAHINGTYTVSVPFIRTKIESMIAHYVTAVLDHDTKIVNSLLTAS